MEDMRYRVGVDVGGTNTDFVVLNESTNEIRVVKVPSTPKAPDRAVIQGVARMAQIGIPTDQISFFSHGTTIATNALIEQKGSRVGLLITQGFRAIQEVGDQTRIGSYELFPEKLPLLAPQSLTWEISERVDSKGKGLKPLDEDAVRRSVNEARNLGVRSFAVCYLFSYMNPEHEIRTKQILREVYPECFVSLSSEILPRIREWPRLSATLINAYLEPVMVSYISRLKKELLEKGLITRQLFVMQSNGGVMSFDAVTLGGGTVRTVLSGPAAGVQAGVFIAGQVGLRDIVTMDMGGTSCDVALVKGGDPVETTYGKVSGRDVHLPLLDVRTIGAGGGTIAWINNVGDLKLGPQSAGADPGPACYGLGGSEPTVTDAALILGYLDPEYFLGGEVRLDPGKAEKAIGEKVAKPLSMDIYEAAHGMIKIVNTNMANAIRVLTAEQGVDPRNLSLIPFGGAGPLCAGEVAEELGIHSILIPKTPGAFSALGLLCTKVVRDFLRSDLRPYESVSTGAINEAYKDLETKAIEVIASEGLPTAHATFNREMDMRYMGQGHELRVPVSSGPAFKMMSEEEKQLIRKRFDSFHESLRGHKAEDEPVELVSYRIRVLVDVPRYNLSHQPFVTSSPNEALKGERKIYSDKKFGKVPVYHRDRLCPGNQIHGPAIVEQLDSTILIHSWQEAQVDGFMNLLIKKKGI